MSEIGAFEAKNRFPHLLQRVEAGDRFVITRHGRPVAELVPFRLPNSGKVRNAIDALKHDMISRRGSMNETSDLLARIAARPETFGGKPVVRDLRISVELILSLLSQGVTEGELLEDYPDLEPEDIRACTAYAHAVVAGDSLATVDVAPQ